MRTTHVLWFLTLCPACETDSKPAGDALTDPSDAALPSDGEADGSQSCTPGTRNCECASGLCREGLLCEVNVCRSELQADASVPKDGDTGVTCGDTTTDPSNCGECGHVCQSGACQAGRCSNIWSACFIESDGFATCEEVCASTGASCSQAGCDQESTLRVWGGASKMECELNIGPGAWDGRACDATLTWGGGSIYKRCCCTGSQ